MAINHTGPEPSASCLDAPAARAYCSVIRSLPSILFALLSVVLVWPRIQMIGEFMDIGASGSHWFAAQFCYSLAAWCILGLIALLVWLLVMFFPNAVLMKLAHAFVVLRTIAWYCTLPGFLFLYITVTSKTCYLNMHVFLVTLIGGLILLFLAGVYAFRLYGLCRITSDMGKTLASGTYAYAFGYSFNMTAVNIGLAAAALFTADFMSNYTFLAMMFKAPYTDMLRTLNAWMAIQTSALEISIGQFYIGIPWIALITAAVNIPMIFMYKKYMKASQQPAKEEVR